MFNQIGARSEERGARRNILHLFLAPRSSLLAPIFFFLFLFLPTPSLAQGNLLVTCQTVGMSLKLDMKCQASCDGTQVDVSTLTDLVPENYISQMKTLCGSGLSCCATKSNDLCNKYGTQVGSTATCKTSCDGSEKKSTAVWDGIPEPCSTGVCCIAGSIGAAGNLSAPSANPGQTSAAIGAPKANGQGSTVVGFGLRNPLGSRSIPTIIGSIINWASGLAGSLFFLYLLWGGFEWMTSGGGGEGVKKGQQKILAAVVGILIIIFAYLAVDALIGLTNIGG
ncbi:MAG: pilin [Patescibacteria group bacterium]